MNNDQITALAREYAEGINPLNRLKNYPEADVIVTIMQDRLKEVMDDKIMDFEGFLHFLLRRFCLVEKSKVKQFFQSRQNILSHQNEYDRYIVDEVSAEKRLMLCLFPEIAKEVES